MIHSSFNKQKNRLKKRQVPIKNLKLPCIFLACPHCRQLLEYLNGNGIQYSGKDVTISESARKDVERLDLERALQKFHSYSLKLYRLNGSKKLYFANQNPYFDLGFLMKHTTFKITFKAFYMYAPIDLHSVSVFLREMGYFNQFESLSLSKLSKKLLFKGGKAHDALVDVKAAIFVWEKLKEIIKEKS